MVSQVVEQPTSEPEGQDAAARWGTLALILVPAAAVVAFSLSMEGWTPQDRIKLSTAVVLSL